MATFTHPHRVMLWGVPMCMSTMFTRCIDAGSSAEIFIEPYDNCHSFGPERRITWPDTLQSSQLVNDWQTYKFTKEVLEKEYPDVDLVFVKDMAFGIEGKYDMIPNGYRHTFMIRDPSKVWVAYRKRIMQLLRRDDSETSQHVVEDLEKYISPTSVFKASFDLMEYVRTSLHQEPVVIDADDLADYPAATLRRYCSAVGIPYKDSMVTPGNAVNHKWHCSEFFTWGGKQGGFYSKAMESKGFMSHKNKSKLLDITSDVEECVVRSQIWYDKLYALRQAPE